MIDILSQIRNGIVDEMNNSAVIPIGRDLHLVCIKCGKDFGIIPEHNSTDWIGYKQQESHNIENHGGFKH